MLKYILRFQHSDQWIVSRNCTLLVIYELAWEEIHSEWSFYLFRICCQKIYFSWQPSFITQMESPRIVLESYHLPTIVLETCYRRTWSSIKSLFEPFKELFWTPKRIYLGPLGIIKNSIRAETYRLLLQKSFLLTLTETPFLFL